MWFALAILLPLAAFAASCAIARGARRRPAPLVAPLGLAVLVCYETLALQLLSLAGAVARPGVALAQLGPALLVVAVQPRAAWRWVRSAPRRVARSGARLGVPGVLIAPLVVLLALSAIRYAPNTWDGMTYHLARVAHWLQHGSVAPYPTHIPRQVVVVPGAEYLLLVLQAISWSDALAGLVQLCSWLLIVWSAPSLARLAGAPKRIARWAPVLVAGLPMGVLQASSTQNDLVGAATCVAILAAAIPFLHRSPGRWRAGDVTLLAVAGTAAALVKPIAIIIASPLLAIAAWRTATGLARSAGRARAIGLLAGNAAISGLIFGRVALQGPRPDAGPVFAPYLFPAWGEWSAKAVNLGAGLAHHLPFPAAVVEALGMDAKRVCRDGWCARLPLSVHEDLAGNPVAAATTVVLLAVAAWRWRALPAIARASTVLTVLAWVVFHMVVRENLWVSRLQLPLFVVSVALLSAVPNGGRSARRAAAVTVAGVALVSLAHGYSVALRHRTRPPLSSASWATRRDLSYYANDPPVRIRHDAALAVAERLGCRRIGLFIGGDSFDYPLTWRAMQRGIEVRHYFGADAWPCVVFTDRGPPPAPPGTPRWAPALGQNVFVPGTAAP